MKPIEIVWVLAFWSLYIVVVVILGVGFIEMVTGSLNTQELLIYGVLVCLFLQLVNNSLK